MDEITSKLDELMGQESYAEAEKLLLYCHAGAVRSGNRALELSLCSELLGFYRMRHIREGFFPIWERTLSLLDELKVENASRGTILINGATGMVSFGGAENALPYYQEAYFCYLRSIPTGDSRFAALFNNMAAAYESVGAFDRAEENMLLALDILLKIPHHLDVATTYVNLAQLYAGQNSSDPRTEECLRKAMERFDDPEVLWDGYYGHTARKCAGAFEALGYAALARELEERAVMVYEGT